MKKKKKNVSKYAKIYRKVPSMLSALSVIKMPASEKAAWGAAESTGLANPSKVYTRSREQKGALPECVELNEK